MKINRKFVQIFLIFSGLFLIIATYIFYPKLNESKLKGSVVNQNQTEKAEDKNLNKDSVFEKVEYQGLYDFDKPFIVISEKAHVMSEFPDIVYMDNMKVTISMDDGRIVIITGDKGIYNKSTYDCFFEGNVKATDGEIVIESGNLDLLAEDNNVSIYNSVNLVSESGSLSADKVDYNFEKKRYKISMFNDEKVKIKLTE